MTRTFTNICFLSLVFDCLTLSSDRDMTRLLLLHSRGVYDTQWEALLKQSSTAVPSGCPIGTFALLEFSIVVEVITY